MTAQISSNNALPQDQIISILYYPGRRPIVIGQVGHTALEIEGTSTHYGLFKKKTLRNEIWKEQLLTIPIFTKVLKWLIITPK